MKNKNVAQFRIDDRFTLSLSDVFTDGLKFEAVLIDNDSKKTSCVHVSDETGKNVDFIDLPEVWDFRDLKNVMSRAVEEANEIIKNEALQNANFIKL